MAFQLSPQDREQINVGIQEKYNKVAVTPKGHFTYPTGREGLKGLLYDDSLPICRTQWRILSVASAIHFLLARSNPVRTCSISVVGREWTPCWQRVWLVLQEKSWALISHVR